MKFIKNRFEKSDLNRDREKRFKNSRELKNSTDQRNDSNDSRGNENLTKTADESDSDKFV